MNNETFDIMKEDIELDAAIAETETEHTSDNQLIDAMEALSQLRSKYFG